MSSTALQALNPLETFLNSCHNIDTLCGAADKIYLWVIDMQNDFIDAAFKDVTLFRGNNFIGNTAKLGQGEAANGFIGLDPGNQIRLVPAPHKKVEYRSDWEEIKENPNDENGNILGGRFAVTEGIHCVDDIIAYVDKLRKNVTVESKIQKVIFSRDIHTENPNKPNHCSFEISVKRGSIDGIGFPAHCVNGTTGCMLHPKIQALCEELGNKATVVMKGCSQSADSFGAYPYSCDQGNAATYTKLRQHNGCFTDCDSGNEGGVLRNTGSVVLSEPERFNKILDMNQSQARTSITKIVEENRDTPNVLHLICGLAGDYCVRDTAINLKFAFPKHKVAVIADAVRYAALPMGAIGVGTTAHITEELLQKDLHMQSFIEPLAGNVPAYFLAAPDAFMYTYSSQFFNNGDAVLFTMDKSRNGNITKMSQAILPKTQLTVGNKLGARSEVNRPKRVLTNKYWCLARYMYLLGKQIEYARNDHRTAYTKATGLEVATVGPEKMRASGELQLKFGGGTRGGRRRRRSRKSCKRRKTRRNRRMYYRRTRR
jgi:nicotinamidase-related amidase